MNLIKTEPTNIAVIILTYNEEQNLPQALKSVIGWAKEIFVLDSFSTDRTMEIAGNAGCVVIQNKFIDFARQRNFALQNLPIHSEWLFFLDADEWLREELKQEISKLIEKRPVPNGFYIKRRFIWMGRWIRRGYYPVWILRMFRYGKGKCEDRAINEHLIVEGEIGYLSNDFMHEDRKGISEWIAKHNDYAGKEALELLAARNRAGYRELDARLFGTQAQRKRWLRYYVWNRIPPLVRPFFYFFYRYIFLGGFFDGKAAFIYHFLQGLWFPLLIDIKYLEFKERRDEKVIQQHGSPPNT